MKKTDKTLTKIQELWASRPVRSFQKTKQQFDDKYLFNLVGKIFCPGPFYYYIFNFAEQKFDHIHQNVQLLHGIAPEEVSIPKFYELTHPDDAEHVLKSEELAAKFLFEFINPKHIPNYKVSYVFRIKRTDGTYGVFQHQAIALRLDDQNSIITVFGVHTDITHLSPTPSRLVSFIDINQNRSYIGVDPTKTFLLDTGPSELLLSSRECEILGHLAEGKSQDEAAELLNLSFHTVRTHMNNIRGKLNASNTTEAVAIAIRSGWI